MGLIQSLLKSVEIFGAFNGLNRLLKQAEGWHLIYFGDTVILFM